MNEGIEEVAGIIRHEEVFVVLAEGIKCLWVERMLEMDQQLRIIDSPVVGCGSGGGVVSRRRV